MNKSAERLRRHVDTCRNLANALRFGVIKPLPWSPKIEATRVTELTPSLGKRRRNAHIRRVYFGIVISIETGRQHGCECQQQLWTPTRQQSVSSQ
jgi:hypothetical protein